MGASAKEVLEYHKAIRTTKGNTLAKKSHIINMGKCKNPVGIKEQGHLSIRRKMERQDIKRQFTI
eukprot:14452758-Ditylum_brightwellii.AAC.1